MDIFPINIKVFKNRKSGEIITLSGGGTDYRKDGHIDGTNGICKKLWASHYSEDSAAFFSDTLIEKGIAHFGSFKFNKDEWEKQLENGDYTVQVHVPFGERLSPSLYADSFEKTVMFYRKYFSDSHH
jgi:hypothetical protein